MGVLKGLQRKGSILLAWLVIAVVGLGVVRPVFAEDLPEYRIQISPTKLDLDLEPGKSTTAKFIVQNSGTKDFDYELSASPYSVKGQEYEQDFATETNYTDIAKWIKFSDEKGKLDSMTSKEITMTIDVSEDVPEGGQYAVVLATMLEPEDNESAGGITALKRVGMLVYSKNVDGNTREEGSVIENKIPSFLFVPPVQTTSVVKNTGNVHATASYTLQVYPFFGGEEVYTNEENPTTLTVLPETSRFNQMEWEGAPQLGVFKVKQTVKFLDDTSVVEKVVFICPLWFLFIVLAIIFLAVFWIVGRVHGRRKETNHD